MKFKRSLEVKLDFTGGLGLKMKAFKIVILFKKSIFLA